MLHIGLKFWKVGSRKIYAVAKAELFHYLGSKGKKRKEVIRVDSDSYNEIQVPKKMKEERELLKEVKELRSDLSAILSVSKGIVRE